MAENLSFFHLQLFIEADDVFSFGGGWREAQVHPDGFVVDQPQD
jgi:hypothetical protein